MTSTVLLRDVTDDDLPIFFEQQRDPIANHMAGFTAKDPSDRDAFNAHWTRIRGTKKITMKTVLFDGHVVGTVGSYEEGGRREVTYWIGREYWGRGIATKALSYFLGQEKTRPLYARAAKDNLASIRVLEKCGFAVCDQGKGYANARGEEIEEVGLVLHADPTGAVD